MKIIKAKDLDLKIKDLVSTIKSGNLIIFPTETLYGIGADALNSSAVDKIFKAKKRPESKPILVLISKLEMLDYLVCEIPDVAKKLINRFWPGPLTIIFKKKENVPKELNPNGNTIAVRMTSSKLAQKIIDLCECPITAPSANISGKEPIKNSGEAMSEFVDCDEIGYMIEDDQMTQSKPSTIVDVSDGDLKIIREGVISEKDIRF